MKARALLGSALALGLFLPVAGTATTFVVDTADDNTDVDGLVTLREALLAADGDVAVGDAPAGSGADVIDLTNLTGSPINLTADLPPISSDITLIGPSDLSFGVNGASLYRLFTVLEGNVRFENIGFEDGLAQGGKGGSGYTGGGGAAGAGGGLLISGGRVYLSNCYFLGCVAQGGSGGDALSSEQGGGGGGGIGSDGTSATGGTAQGGDGGDGGVLGGLAGLGGNGTEGDPGDDGAGGGGGGGSFGGTGFGGAGGAGGFLGGGGGGGSSPYDGGNGGYGGGGGGGDGDSQIGLGGTFGGSGTRDGGLGGPGGGGAGLGGAIFVRTGAYLNMSDVSIFTNSASPGPGGQSPVAAEDGEGHGGGVFVMPGATALGIRLNFAANSAADATGTEPFAFDVSLDTPDVYGTINASEVIVTTLTDEDDGPGAGDGVSLRDALNLIGPGGTVRFMDGLSGTSTMLLGEFIIGEDVTILGPGPGEIELDANNASRHFLVTGDASQVRIEGLSLVNGLVSAEAGGSISNSCNDLVLSDLSIFSCSASDGGGIANTGGLTINSSDITNNTASADGGGIHNVGGTLLITDSEIYGNQAFSFNGGGINNVDGTVTIINSNIEFNSVSGTGSGAGGIHNSEETGTSTMTIIGSSITDNSAQSGGGIMSAGVLNIFNSTISGNQADIFDGGGIMNFGSTVNIVNSTISGNAAAQGGGGIFNQGVIQITNSTITDNEATGGDGGGILNDFGAGGLGLRNSIVAGNRDTSGNGPDILDDVGSAVTSGGGNIVGDATGTATGVFTSTNDQAGTAASPLDPLLGPLEDNGGPVQTHHPLAGSPVLDNGINAFVDSTTFPDPPFTTFTDARGVARINNTSVDSGAVEAITLLLVDSTEDVNDGIITQGNLELREALALIAPGGTIDFDPSVFFSKETIFLSDEHGRLDVTKPLTMKGPGSSILCLDGQEQTGAFVVLDDVTGVELSGFTVRDVIDTDDGRSGGLYVRSNAQVNVHDAHFLDCQNTAGVGGAIAVLSGASLSLYDSIISDSETVFSGGAIFTQAANLLLERCSVIRNRSADGGSGLDVFAGSQNANVTIVNSTFGENSSDSGLGGAILLDQSTAAATVNIRHSTLINNPSGGAAIDIDRGGTVSLSHSIVANESGEALSANSGSGLFASDGFNLISSEAGIAPSSIQTHELYAGSIERIVDPVLGDNGGPTLTYPVRVSGPAVDGGDPLLSTPPATDQRGQARVYGAAIDLGAVEAIDALTVDSVDNSDDGDLSAGNVTLREAIRYTGAGGRVLFANSLYSPTPAVILAGPEYVIVTDKNIEGPGSGQVTVDGGFETRPFAVLNGRLEAEGIDIANGLAAGGSGGDGANGGGGGAGAGGGVFVASGAVANFRNCAFRNNSAMGGDGGSGDSFAAGGGGGGGIGGLGADASGFSASVSTLGNGGNGGSGALFGNDGALGGIVGQVRDGGDGLRGAGGGGGGYNADLLAGGNGGTGGDFAGGGGASASASSPSPSGGDGGFGGGGGGALDQGGAQGAGGLHGGEGAFLFTGGAGGGGGAGLGGAVFFDSGAFGSFESCSFDGNSAIGGSGGLSDSAAFKKGEKGTISGPGLEGEGKGGAVYLRSGADVTFLFGNTFGTNSASSSVGTGFTEGTFGDSVDVYGTAGLSEVIVTTTTDENDGALGIGSGESVREALALVGFGGKVLIDAAAVGSHVLGSELVVDRDVTIEPQTDPFILDGNGLTRAIMFSGDAVVSLSDTTIENTQTSGSGGALYNDGATVKLAGVRISGSSAAQNGGGIFNAGTLTISRCEIDSVSSEMGFGGGIANFDGGSLELHNSTIANGTAGSSFTGGREGGGVYNGAFARATFVNATLSGNTADMGGGGLYNKGRAVLTNDTLTNNSSLFSAGGLYNATGGSVILRNSILAANTGAGSESDLGSLGGAESGGGNVIGIGDHLSATWIATDQTGSQASPIDPMLTPLGSFGGFVSTHALFPFSPALDAGDNAFVTSEIFPFGTQDAREAVRIYSGIADAGAYESGDYDGDSVLDHDEIDITTRSAAFADGNGDGVNDLTQSDVASFRNTTTGESMTFVTSSGTFSVANAVLPPAARSSTRAGVNPADFPLGFYDFTVTGLIPGETFLVDLFLAADPGQQNAYGYGPTLTNTGDHLYDFNFNGTVGAQYPDFPALDHIQLTMIEGATEADQDLTADGELSHFGAIGVSAPTIAEIVSLEATTPALGASVTVTWETASEINNLGFHVYRAVPAGAGFVVGERLTSALIVAQGSEFSGASYAFVDNDPLSAPDDVRGYFLVDLDASGKQTRHGPAVVSVKSQPSSVGDWMVLDR
ncbi:MAG: hypothetical protein PWP23_2845 [Candidatus Sumerlaeota bacterium]|nr:hypothetical protein [Candidatus Sumerlaeota bacterium]